MPWKRTWRELKVSESPPQDRPAMAVVSDKAVSTEDLVVAPKTGAQQVARLSGVLNTLLESKVEAIKGGGGGAANHLRRPRVAPSAAAASSSGERRRRMRRRRDRRLRRLDSDEVGLAAERKPRRHGRSRQRISSSSIDSPNHHRYDLGKCCDADEDNDENFLFDPERHRRQPCCCRQHETNADTRLHFDEDYISLRIEDDDDDDDGNFAANSDDEESDEALRRARRKRRRRRRKRALARSRRLAAVAVDARKKVPESPPDDLPQRARWTIVATACLLLFMCLLLVGVTLRMAPIIDDMVRRENEELINSINREQHSASTNASSTPSVVGKK